MSKRAPHPLEHHPSYRAVIAAAPPLAAFTTSLRPSTDLIGALAVACGDLALGFAAPPGSRRRVQAHHRAWRTVRDIDRTVQLAVRRRLAPSATEIVLKAQRAIDRADVLISALPGVLPM